MKSSTLLMTSKNTVSKWHITIKSVHDLSEYEIHQLNKLTFGARGDMQEDLQQSLTNVTSTDEVVVIRKCSDKILGWCLVKQLGDIGCDFESHLSFFVDSRYRRQGIGRLLVDTALQIASKPMMTMHCLPNGDFALFAQYVDRFVEIR